MNIIWTLDETEILKIHGPNKSIQALSEILPKHNIKAILNKLFRIGIHKTKDHKSGHARYARSKVALYNLYKLKIEENDLTQETKQILIGGLLGDGGIKKTIAAHCIFAEAHGIKQREYIKWKATMMPELKPKLYDMEKKPGLFTPSHPMFTKLRQEFYGSGKKKNIIPLTYAQTLNELGLLIWYLDDGHYKKGYPLITSCMFSYENLYEVVKTINHNLGIALTIQGRNYNKSIYIGKKNKRLLFPAWKSLAAKYNLPHCMLYKLGM